MAKKRTKLTNHGQPWNRLEVKALKAASKAEVPMKQLVRDFGRTQAALRAKASVLGFGLGHRQWQSW
jgi:hypothetical protein